MYVYKGSTICAGTVLLEGTAIEQGYAPIKVHNPPPPDTTPEDVRLAAFDRNVLSVKLVWDTVSVPSPAM